VSQSRRRTRRARHHPLAVPPHTRQMGSWRSTLFRALRAHYERVHPGGHGGPFSLSGVPRTDRKELDIQVAAV